jgi:hypothetical protein
MEVGPTMRAVLKAVCKASSITFVCKEAELKLAEPMFVLAYTKCTQYQILPEPKHKFRALSCSEWLVLIGYWVNPNQFGYYRHTVGLYDS